MSKVIFLADVHLGVPGRLKDIIWGLKVTERYCLEHNIETVVILGDLFHDRESIRLDVINETFTFFSESIKKGIKWIVFPGNHDMFLKRSWNYSAIKPLSNIITVIDTVKILDIDGSRFWILPFIYSENAYMRILNRINKQHQEGDVLLTHIGVNNAKLNTCFLLQHWALVTFVHSKFDKIYTGHFHARQKVGWNTWYVGSIIPFKFDEGNRKHGFFVYDLDKRKHKFIDLWDFGQEVDMLENCAPKFYTIPIHIIPNIKKDISGAHIRIAMKKEPTPQEKKEATQILKDLGVKKIVYLEKFKSQDIKFDMGGVPDWSIQTPVLFQKWIKSDKKGTEGLSKSLLRRLNDEIITIGDEEYQRMKLED